MKEIGQTEKETIVAPRINKISSAIALLYEKLCQEYQLTQDEIFRATVTINKGEVNVKVRGKNE